LRPFSIRRGVVYSIGRHSLLIGITGKMNAMNSRLNEDSRRKVLRAETIGIIIFVLIGFVIVLLRYGRFLNWQLR
jgi:hypothetical protein